MKKKIFVIAMEEEKKLISKNDDFIITGIGGLNVIKSLMGINRNVHIINIGYAGSNVLPIGSRVRVGRVSLYHPNAEYDEPDYILNGNVPCFTSCDFVTETRIKTPCVFDMELAYIMALGFKNVSSIKIVSDNLSQREFERTVKSYAK